MTALATLITAWAAVYGYVCAYSLLLYRERRADREYLAFGMLAGGMTVYAIGQALFVQADSFAEAAAAMRVNTVGAALGLPFFVELTELLSGRPSGRLRMAAFGWSAATIVLLLLGLVVEDTPGRSADWGFDGAPVYYEASVTAIGHATFGASIVIGGIALARIAPVARKNRSLLLVLLGLTPAILASTHDFLVRDFGLRSVYLLEHALLLVVIAMSYVLLDRFVRTARELEKKTGELARSYDAVRERQAELVRKEQLAAVGELSAVIAHEVRNPLAVIKNAASGLRRASLRPGDHGTLLGILDEETDRLTRLMQDLLAYARPIPPAGRVIDVRALVKEAVDAARARTQPAATVEVEVDLEGAPESLHGDGDLLRHALVNIAENAFQAMPGGGHLAVRVRSADLDGQSGVAIAFEDDGEGMEPAVRQKARDPFFTTRPSGTGLGLAIVDRVVRNHGGRVEIASRRGEGTTVVILLPRQRMSLMPAAPLEPPGAGERSAG